MFANLTISHTHIRTHTELNYTSYTHTIYKQTHRCALTKSLSLSLMLTDSEKLNMQTKTRSSAPYGSAVNLK